MANEAQFEEPLNRVRRRLEELQGFAESPAKEREVAKLREKLTKLSREIYENLTPWQKTLVARHPNRPFTLDYVRVLIQDFVEWQGDRAFADDPAIVAGFGLLGDRAVAVIGHQKGRDTKEKIRRNFGMPRPEGLPQGPARHEARREIPEARPHVHRHARARIPASRARSGACPRRSRGTSSRWPRSGRRSSRP